MPDIIDQIIEFFSGAAYVVPVDRQVAAREHVARWLSANAGEVPRWFLSRSDFATRLTQLIDDPFRLTQGSYDWCVPTAFLFSVLRRFPERVAAFATSVYDTGDGDLGDMSVSANGPLKVFDLPTYAAGAMPGKPLPANRGGRPAVYRSADWILLAVIVDEANDAFDFEGPLDDLGAAPPITTAALGALFDDCGLYEGVDEVAIASGDTAASIATKLNVERGDVVLQGDMSFLTKGVSLLGGHAAALAAPVQVVGANLRLSWFSFGDGLNAAEVRDPAILAEAQHATFTADTTPSALRAAMRGILVARARAGM